VSNLQYYKKSQSLVQNHSFAPLHSAQMFHSVLQSVECK